MTVYDPTDLVPLRLETRNGSEALVTTSGVTFVVTTPAGVESSPLTAVETSTGQWDLDVNVASAPFNGQTGVYVWRGLATGAVTGEESGWFVVQARRAPGPAWTPALDQVADWIVARTLSSIQTPGVEDYLGTFTATTTPTDEQAQRHVINAVAYVRSQVGQVIDADLYDDARAAAAIVAAAYIELAYPARVPDLSTYDRLWAQATAMLTSLASSNAAQGSAPATLAGTLVPQWSYPDPEPWGDRIIP